MSTLWSRLRNQTLTKVGGGGGELGTLTNVLSPPIVLFNILCCHNEMFESGCMAKNQKKPVNACVYILSYRRFCVTPYMINVTCSYSSPNTCNTYTFVFSSKRNVLMREKNVSISYILFHIASFLKRVYIK